MNNYKCNDTPTKLAVTWTSYAHSTYPRMLRVRLLAIQN